MKKLILKGSLFLLLTGIIILLIATKYTPFTDLKNNYLASVIEKHARADSLPSPKMIFVGGSNVAFGIECQRIEYEIGINTQNMALHAGLGFEFMLNEAMDVSKNGDIVVLSPEYFIDLEGQPDLLELTNIIYPKSLNYSTHNLSFYADVYFKSFQKEFNYTVGNIWIRPFDTSSVYVRNAFNKWGDVVKHLDSKQPVTIANRATYPLKEWGGIELLKSFCAEAKRKGIRVFITFPGYPQTEYTKNAEAISMFYKQVQMTDVEILGNPSDFVFSDTLFFDSIYHLRRQGRDLRTAKIIELLKTALGATISK